jgi:4-amino-4-deoxy-L-arabinose transferase-like glycosyltransferase
VNRRNLYLFLGFLFAFKVWFSSLVGLGDDEAYYWVWSQNLSWSYFDHPGMVAWLIRLSTEIFGNHAWSLRLPSVLSHVLGGYFLFCLADDMFARRSAWIALSLYVLIPGLSLGSFLMVPDAPMTVAWLATAYFGYKWLVVLKTQIIEPQFISKSSKETRALTRKSGGASYLQPPGQLDERLSASLSASHSHSLSGRQWLTLGLMIGLGILSKYTSVFIALSLMTWTLLYHAEVWKRRGPWLTLVVSAVCSLPILVWNHAYGWPTLAYHLVDRQTGGGGANFSRWLQYFFSQVAVLSPVVFCFILAAWYVSLRKWQDLRWRYLFFISSPLLLVFSVQALFAEFKPHWPMPGWAVLIVGAAELLRRFARARWSQALVAMGVYGIMILFNVFFYAQVVYPVVPKWIHPESFGAIWQPEADPTNDLYGWPEVAQRAQELALKERETGQMVFLSSYRYQLSAQLAFAAGERVWRIFPTRDQYMLDQKDAASNVLVGQSSVFVVDQRYRREPNEHAGFESCSPEEKFPIYRSGVLSRVFSLWVCRGFKGLPRDPS